MGKRKGLDIFLIVAFIVLTIMAIAQFVISLVSGQIFGAFYGLFMAAVSIVLVIRVLLISKELQDGEKTIVSKEDINKITDKMKK